MIFPVRLRVRWICVLTLLACGCEMVRVTPAPLPTLYVIPSITPLTPMPAQATTGSPSPAATGTGGFQTLESTPLAETPLPDLSPSADLPTLAIPSLLPTPQATHIPQPKEGSAAIQFYAPGPLSKLVSPLLLYGYAVPGYGSKGTATLYGEDGRVLASDVLQLNTALKWAYFEWLLPFEVRGAGELGRLSLSTLDEYQRVTSLYSLHLVLLPEGLSIVNRPGDFKERCLVVQPAEGRRIAGGSLEVVGEMRPFNDLPLVVELVGRDGTLLDAQPVPIAPTPGDDYVAFQVSLHYSIRTAAWARLTVYQEDARIPGMMYLYSREVFLNP